MSVRDTLNKTLKNCILCAFDNICGLGVGPLPDGVKFRFQTCRPLVPIAEIFVYDIGHPARDMTPEGLVTAQFPVLQGLKTAHRLQLGGLAQNATYWYRITAGDAVEQGTFTTGTRNASVWVTAIDVFRDGDPGANGEMQFRLFVYDSVRGHALASSVLYPSDNIADLGDGDSVPWPWGRRPVFRIPGAPETITLQAWGADEDGDIFGHMDRYIVEPEFAPPLGQTQGTDGNWEWAQVVQEVRVPDTDGQGLGYSLNTGNTGVAFNLDVELRSDIDPPSQSPKRWPHSLTSRAPSGTPPAAGLRFPGQVAHVEQPGCGRLLFALGPGGVLLWQRWERRGWRRRRDALWVPIGAGLHDVLIDMRHDGVVDLVGLTADGRCVHRQIDPWRTESSATEWVDLDGPQGTRIVAVRSRDERLELLCLDAEHYLHHRTLARKRHASVGSLAWRRLGGPFHAVQAMADPAGRLDVFSLTATGEVMEAQWEDTDSDSAYVDWRSLGGSFDQGTLLASQDADGLAVLAVVNRERIAHVKVRFGGEWRPGSGRWLTLGQVDFLDSAAFEAAQSLVPIS